MPGLASPPSTRWETGLDPHPIITNAITSIPNTTKTLRFFIITLLW
jgi:hypothetical protein